MNRLRKSSEVDKCWSWSGHIYAVLKVSTKIKVRPFQTIAECEVVDWLFNVQAPEPLSSSGDFSFLSHCKLYDESLHVVFRLLSFTTSIMETSLNLPFSSITDIELSWLLENDCNNDFLHNDILKNYLDKNKLFLSKSDFQYVTESQFNSVLSKIKLS